MAVLKRHDARMTITDFTALTIRLPMLDQATLSQAWRDALHTTTLRSGQRATRQDCVEGIGGQNLSRPYVPTNKHIQRHMPLQHTQSAPKRRPVSVHAPERKQSALACRKAFLPVRVPQSKNIGREQFTLTLANGERLCFVVAQARQGLVVTVLCASHVQADIRRALLRIASACAQRAIAVNVVAFGGNAHG